MKMFRLVLPLLVVFSFVLLGCNSYVDNIKSLVTPTEKPKIAVAKSTSTNPIDSWFTKMEKQYGNSHTDGWIAYTYGNAWKAELYKLVNKINTLSAKKYYDSVVKKAKARNNQLMNQEIRIGWTTGSSGRVELACAKVYKNGLFQFTPTYSDFIFDADAATKKFLKGK